MIDYIDDELDYDEDDLLIREADVSDAHDIATVEQICFPKPWTEETIRHVDEILKMSMMWDTMVGVARRSWARNENALSTAAEFNRTNPDHDVITLPYVAEDSLIEEALKETI